MQMKIGLLLLLTVELTLAAHGLQKLFGWFGRPGLHGTGNSFKCWGSVLIASTRSWRVSPKLSAAFCWRVGS